LDFAEYRTDRRFTRLEARTKRNHEVGFRMVGGHILKDGRKLGSVRVTAIDTAVVDALYEKLLVVKETNADGKTIERERRTTEVTRYRPRERPNAVRVIHKKTNEENWIPLFDESSAPLYPELTAELDAIKRTRIAGLMLRRDWGQHAPWPTWPKEDEVDLTHMSRKVKEVIRAAGLRDELTFTSFRHGGFTEAADSDLTDAEMRAQGRHKSAKALPRYAKRTMKQVAVGARKRRAARTDGGQMSE
jgi:hypothetical protein